MLTLSVRATRLWLATSMSGDCGCLRPEARAAGRGDIALVSQLAGIARRTIGRGPKDLDREVAQWPHGLIRRSGGGRRATRIEQPGLRKALPHLVASATRGDPQADLLWVSRSHR